MESRAPAIDLLAPDFYNPDFKHWCDLYTRAGDPLFIPEHRFEKELMQKLSLPLEIIIVSLFLLSPSNQPMSQRKRPIGKTYNILNQLTPLITKYQPQVQ
jgi:hypothetical protein